MLLLSADGTLLMLRGHDPHQPTRSWWFTPGGGVDAGESSREAACRELEEETGYVVAPEELIGPVWERMAYFDFMSRPYVQHEFFFVARLSDADASPQGNAAWTVTEQETIDEVAWLSHEDLRHASIEVFPEQLRDPWDAFSAWDGIMVSLGKAHE